MKTKIRVKYLTTALAFVRFATLIALLSYSCGQPVLSILAKGKPSIEMAQTRLHTNPNPGSLMSSGPNINQQPQPQAVETSRKMPLAFVENLGQVDSHVAYYVQGVDKSLYFTSEGITFVFTDKASRHDDESSALRASPRSVSRHMETSTEDATQYAVKMNFIGARAGVRPKAQDATSCRINYFKGARDHWKTGVRTYSTLIYSDLWPGIDLIYTGTAEQLKYSFNVKPGADPNRIRLAYRGASQIKLDNQGQLEVITPVGSFKDERPSSYQDVDGKRVQIDTAYVLGGRSATGEQDYAFHLARYNKSEPLVIDPEVRVYTGFIGGAGEDYGNGIAVDNDGNAYVVGTTTSISFPDRSGLGTIGGRGRSAMCTSRACSRDAFVVKVKADGTGFDYASFIGGSGQDEGNGIAVDPLTGESYIVGTTNDSSFPLTKWPSSLFSGERDAFVAKLDKNGALVYSGFIGGISDEDGRGIAVDSAGNAYVTGKTFSDETSFPHPGGFGAIPGLIQTFTTGPGLFAFYEAFVVKVSFDGTAARLDYATYIGGQFDDEGNGIAVDKLGNAFIVGTTESPGFEDPVYPSPAPSLLPHSKFGLSTTNSDAFVVGLNSTGDSALYVGFVGGIQFENGNGIALDSMGNTYITGGTTSSPTSFPAFRGPSIDQHGGEDAFVARISSDGTKLDSAGYIGGLGDEEGKGIAVNADGNAYITGFTESNGVALEDGFPGGSGIDSLPGPDRVLTGVRDAFLVRVAFDLAADSVAFDLASYIGGLGEEDGNAVAVDRDGNAYVTGRTNSPFLFSFRFRGPASPDPTFNGGTSDAFVEKIGTGTPGGLVFPPIISSCPDHILVTAQPGENFATVNYPLPNITTVGSVLVAVPPPGAVFPVGTTAVNIIEIDASGDASVLCSFTITVNPAPPPPLALNCVGDLHVVVPPGHPSVVNYPVPVVNKPEGATVVCMPPPGSIFPVGTTTVNCTAGNAGGETASCSFIVSVH